MASKNERELKVCALSGHNYKPVPSIRLMGQWLEAAGFHIGDPVLVRCEDGKLIISLDTARAEMIEAEKAFMEKETRKLHEKFLKEKKALHVSITLKFCTFFTPKKCTGTTDVSLRVNHLFPLNDNFHQLFLQL